MPFNLFGKPRATSAPEAATPANTTTGAQDLGEALELCEKREAHVQRLVQREIEAARTLAAAGKRPAAIEAVKRKKIHEKELERISVHKLNLVQQESTLHALRFNNVVLASQERGAEAIAREVQRSGGAEGADRVLDKLEDALDEAGEILGASARKLGTTAELDEEELLEELEQMELADELVDITGVEGASGAAGSSSGVRAAAPVPLAVPRTIPAQQAAKRAEEERELDELVALQASMKVEHPPMPRPIMAAVHPSMKIEQAMPMPMMAAVF